MHEPGTRRCRQQLGFSFLASSAVIPRHPQQSTHAHDPTHTSYYEPNDTGRVGIMTICASATNSTTTKANDEQQQQHHQQFCYQQQLQQQQQQQQQEEEGRSRLQAQVTVYTM